MLGLKVSLRDAEQWKRYLLDNALFDKGHAIIREKDFIIFPVNKRFQSGDMFVERKFKILKHRIRLKDSLKKSLTDREMSQLNKAHDIIGDIAILEIPRKLARKQKLIAKELLKTNPNIKTVLKKAASHEGIFRTQKMQYLAGEKKKETLYKENNVVMKLDVEKVYFSVRLAHERKRIMQLVKPGEEIMVMFSGCAPYPLVLSKNTKARNITGIEINPYGHKYALENLKLNRINNVILVNGDVKKIVPNIMKYVVGLKSAAIPREEAKPLEEVKHFAHIYELHLFDNDLFEHRQKIENAIKHLQSLGIRVFMHMPFRIYLKGKKSDIKMPLYNLEKEDIGKEIEMLTLLGEICRKYDAKAIVHANDHTKDLTYSDKRLLVDNIRRFEKYYDWFYFETLTTGFSTLENVLEIGKAAGIKNLCIDIVHQYIMYKDNDKMVEVIKKLKENFNTYFHVADHDGITHTCEIGKGFIDWKKMAPLINTGVLEIESKDYIDDFEMLRSHKTLNKYSALKKYDRIIMPLPKTADHFLGEALALSKKGTIIHFYDFIPGKKAGRNEGRNDGKSDGESDGESDGRNGISYEISIKKIDTACRKNNFKYKILDKVKCGQQAPSIYRVCVDFEIL